MVWVYIQKKRFWIVWVYIQKKRFWIVWVYIQKKDFGLFGPSNKKNEWTPGEHITYWTTPKNITTIGCLFFTTCNQ
jgi:hypothetical protein